MYSGKFNVSVLVGPGNEIAREDKSGIVTIPFGTEYKLKLSNNNSSRAVAHVFIDEVCKTSGGLVINAHECVVLECDISTRNTFLFVSEKSDEAISEGKNYNTDGENGAIKVRFHLEKPRPQHCNTVKSLGFNDAPTARTRSLGAGGQSIGATVEGSHSNQKFNYVDIQTLNEYVEIRLLLRGGDINYTRNYCGNCGKSIRNSHKYCPYCGIKI